MSTSERRQTCLLGPNRLQLELMSHFITQRANFPCTVVPALDAVPCTPDTSHLILHDCNQWKEREKSECGSSSREVDVLASIRQGRSNEMIAEELCLSPHTVKTHVYRIFKKIKVSSRLQAANWSSQHLCM